MVNSKTISKRAILVALFAAFVCVGCFIQIPLPGGVPIVIQDMMAMLSGLILGPLYGSLSVLIFLILGSVGLPVFTGKGGLDKITNGPTGGFLIGYLAAALVAGLIVHFFVKEENPESSKTTKVLNWIFFAVAAIVATVVCFVFGIWGFHRVKPDIPMQKVYEFTLIPFIPGNIIKLIVMIPLSKKLYPIVKRYLAN